MLYKKNILIVHPTDNGACAWYRLNFAAALLHTSYAGEIEVITSREYINDGYILTHCAAIVIGRPTDAGHVEMVRRYARNRKKYGYRIVVDYDDVLFDVDGKNPVPSYNRLNVDAFEIGRNISEIMNVVDKVTVSTPFLAFLFKSRFGVDATIIENAVPSYAFGSNARLVKEDIKKPVVLYAGTMTHFSETDAGDFAGPWIPWIKESVKEGKIEFHVFGKCEILGDADVVTHPYTNALQFPSVIAGIRPDIYIAPLADNDFNRAKSNLKMLEAAAIGAAFLGSSFLYSPYLEIGNLCQLVNRATTPDMIDAKVETICRKDVFNGIMASQAGIMERGGYWLESRNHMDKVLKAWFGDNLEILK